MAIEVPECVIHLEIIGLFVTHVKDVPAKELARREQEFHKKES